MNTKQYGLRFDTPLGPFRVTTSEHAVLEARFDEAPCALPSNALCERAAVQVREYLAGTRRQFALPLDPQGTDFQRAVWAALQQIAYGETLDYATLAERVGRPGAARAVGTANGRNPLWLLIPCHRVIARDGSLAGYAGGLARKQALLSMEAADATA